MSEKFDSLIGRTVVFSYRNDVSHERLYLVEGKVDQAVADLVKLSGKWYLKQCVHVEAVLPIGASDANEE